MAGLAAADVAVPRHCGRGHESVVTRGESPGVGTRALRRVHRSVGCTRHRGPLRADEQREQRVECRTAQAPDGDERGGGPDQAQGDRKVAARVDHVARKLTCTPYKASAGQPATGPTTVPGRHDARAVVGKAQEMQRVLVGDGADPGARMRGRPGMNMKCESGRRHAAPSEAAARVFTEHQSRRSPRLPTLVTSIVSVFASSCVAFGPRERRDVQWPAALLVEWSSGNPQRPNDSTIWAFRTRGSLDISRQTVRMADARPLLQQHLVRHLYWWTEPRDKSGARQLCYTQRPGRDGSSCVEYEFGSRPDTAGHVRRTLTLTGRTWNFRSVSSERSVRGDGP